LPYSKMAKIETISTILSKDAFAEKLLEATFKFRNYLNETQNESLIEIIERAITLIG